MGSTFVNKKLLTIFLWNNNMVLLDVSDEEDEEIPLKAKRLWVRPYYKERDASGAQTNIVSSLKNLDDFQLYHSYMRMSHTKYGELLGLIEKDIAKKTLMRHPLNPETRLSITLRYLATGESQRSLSLAYKCSTRSSKRIIEETTDAIYKALVKKVFPILKKDTFERIATGFEEKWNFPNCVGAIDGKHINIQAPPNSGSMFYNYKKQYSIVLMAICDHNYNFITCSVGSAGRESDGGAFQNTTFGKRIYENTFQLPERRDVNDDFRDVPYVFVADDAFKMSENLLKPFSKKNLTIKERVFNYRCSRARRVVENSFGLLSSKWRIFRTTINAEVPLVEKITLACICLHNWLLQTGPSDSYISESLNREEENPSNRTGYFEENTNFTPMEVSHSVRNSSKEAKMLRERFARYFCESGKVDWQDAAI